MAAFTRAPPTMAACGDADCNPNAQSSATTNGANANGTLSHQNSHQNSHNHNLMPSLSTTSSLGLGGLAAQLNAGMQNGALLPAMGSYLPVPMLIILTWDPDLSLTDIGSPQ